MSKDDGCLASIAMLFLVLLIDGISELCSCIAEYMNIPVIIVVFGGAILFAAILYLIIKTIEFRFNRLKRKAISISEKYPLAFNKRLGTLKKSIDDLTIKELRSLVNINLDVYNSEETILQQIKIQDTLNLNKYRDIKYHFPNGLYEWERVHHFPLIQDTILHEDEIENFEYYYKKNKEFSDWELEQRNFSTECIELANQHLEKWGHRRIRVDIGKIGKDGHALTSDYWVDQFFLYDICKEPDLDYSNFPNLPKNKEYMQIVKERGSIQREYNSSIVNFITNLRKNNDVLVYMNPDVADWSSDELFRTYYYYSSNIKSDIFDPVFLQGIIDIDENDWLKSLNRRIVIIDMVSDNIQLQRLSRKIITRASNKKPLICYISFFKCYERDEMLDLIDEKKCELEKLKARDKIIFEGQHQQWPLVKGIRHYFFYYYYPWDGFDETNISSTDIAIRSMIWEFKKGEIMACNRVCDDLCAKLKSIWGETLSDLTLVCIPASTKESNQTRYEKFSEYVCRDTGMTNSYKYINIIREKSPSHALLGGNEKSKYSFNEKFFKGRKIILFDDVVTRGHSLEEMKIQLNSMGAIIVAALSIGKTYKRGAPLKPHPWLVEKPDALEEWFFD